MFILTRECNYFTVKAWFSFDRKAIVRYDRPSSIVNGVPAQFHFNGSVGPLECIFMALLALFNEGVPAHFFRLMEVPTVRLPNVKMLLRWPSRMHIYGFV